MLVRSEWFGVFLGFCRRDVYDRLQKTPELEPVDPFESGEGLYLPRPIARNSEWIWIQSRGR